MIIPLPPFSGDRPTCGKCGHHDATVKHTPVIPMTLCRAVTPTGMPERLCRDCQRCGYHWDEALAVHADAVPDGEHMPLGQQFGIRVIYGMQASSVVVKHTPSGLQKVLCCGNQAAADAAVTPLWMFQQLLDDVDAWRRQPIGASCSPAAEPVEPEPVDCARCGETDHCACWHDACCTCGSKSHAACGTHPDVSGSVAHGRNCPDCIGVAEAYANEEQQ